MFQKIKLLLLWGILLCSNLNFAQSLQADLQKIVQPLASASSVAIRVQVTMYSRKGGPQVYATNASMLRDQQHSLHVLGDQENFASPKYQVNVDHTEKTVLIVPKAEAPAQPEKITADLRQLQQLIAKRPKDAKVVTLVSDQAGIRKYRVTKVPGYDEIVLVLNMTTLAIQSIAYTYSANGEMKGQYVLLDYTEFKSGTDLSAHFKTARYFTVENGKYHLSASFKQYQLFTDL